MRIAIIGGGIGGLTTALALRQFGFEPEVFEQAPELLEVGAAILMWPNVMRVLHRLGFSRERSSAWRCRRANSLAQTGWKAAKPCQIAKDGRAGSRYSPCRSTAGIAARSSSRFDPSGSCFRSLRTTTRQNRRAFFRPSAV